MRGRHGDTLAPADDQYGETTGAWLRAVREEDEATAEALLNSEPPAGHSHARARTPRPSWLTRFLHRDIPAPAAPVQDQGGEMDTSAKLASVIERFPAAAEVARDRDPEPTMAVSPAELADDLITDPAPDPRPYAPDAGPVTLTGTRGADGYPLVRDAIGVRPATWGELYGLGVIAAISPGSPDGREKGLMPGEVAQEWGTWDTPANREPLDPAPYRWDLRADFRDLPLFKSAVRAACAAGLRAIGTRGVHPAPPLPDYDLDRFAVEPDGIDLEREFDLIEARAARGFYRADRVFHGAGPAGSRAGAAA